MLLRFLFLGDTTVLCPDAADADDNGQLDLSDSINILHVLFLGQSQLPPPFPTPGVDPTADALGCQI